MFINFRNFANSKVVNPSLLQLHLRVSARVFEGMALNRLWLCLLFCHALSSGLVFAQTVPKNSSVQTAQEQIKSLLDPIRGLNAEISAGLLKIEQTCAMISKMKLNEAKQLVEKAEVKSTGLRNEMNTMRQITVQQSQLFSAKVEEAQQRLSGQLQACEELPTRILRAEACTSFRANKEAVQKVSDAGSYFYSEALARVKTYEHALELETNGCTRPGFFIRLWSAEQSHLMPALKTSAQSFSELLK